ncbi:uncharacterized protein CPUR_01880 [Claviceps purpurea 20.1]|uniref:Uncharacterized protein n=1 Tax=Claviceps purpurea (strain 20.1) TaxID=1111077 RepID=M1W3D3_CLAP2|nr:hypothetical protein E4U12_003935 [Claviceps purpurea]KAG6163025.1 hypothetical protein E4U11_002184 [Claviceps purpurea]KAG6204138.1 hypothetical protein E4U50_005382 [Claviceps purpurea]CCE28405.1 uncharacterized protein CPUR_01880 [Claviceps purpurea 20.1]
MAQLTSLLCSPQRQPSSQHTGQTKLIVPETDANAAQQEVQLPEMRILEMIKLAQLEKENHAMRPSWREALEPQDINGTLPSQGGSGDEAAESIIPPSGSAIRDDRDARTKTESANIPSAPRLNRPRKRAYQMLEEEAGKILKGWAPSTQPGAGTRGSMRKPCQENSGDVKASTNFKSHGKPIPDSLASTTSRRGASRTGCATNAATPSNDPESAENLNKARISPKVQKGRVMKITPQSRRGRGRPKKGSHVAIK